MGHYKKQRVLQAKSHFQNPILVLEVRAASEDSEDSVVLVVSVGFYQNLLLN